MIQGKGYVPIQYLMDKHHNCNGSTKSEIQNLFTLVFFLQITEKIPGLLGRNMLV